MLAYSDTKIQDVVLHFVGNSFNEELLTLGNIVRFYMSMGEVIQEGDLSNFDLITWLKAVNK